MLLKLALKNITRKKTRSFLAIIGIMAAVFVLRMSSGLVIGVEKRALEPIRIIFGGDIIVAPKKFGIVEENPGSYTFNTGDEKGEFFVNIHHLEPALEKYGITYSTLYLKCLLPAYNMEPEMVMGRNIQYDTRIFHMDQRTQGRYFTKNDEGTHKAIIDTSSERWGKTPLDIGDHITILFPHITKKDNRLILDFSSGTPVDFEIIGIYSGGIVSTTAIWIPQKTLQDITKIEGTATYTAIITDNSAPNTLNPALEHPSNTVFTTSDMMEMLSKDFKEFKEFIRVIIFITYIVSALILTNVMLTAVAEREHEIGILKSIGAKNKEIIRMTVYESAFLGLIGGVLGFFCGSLVATLLSGALFFDIEPVISNVVIIVFICSAAGLYPAIKASHVPPMEVLRYE
ncbi:MAG: FtsX-like permease family protein [Candidatus Methanofastidiosia archaeon]|jgi:ABC-type antimicrobial peptide transport system permease subunit